MAKPKHKIKKANHGKRPANSRVRKEKRHRVKT
ncbi:MAG: 50S ribosomal protein bL37 [Pirellulales bacterium]